MAPRDPSHEPTGTPDPIEKGFATFATLRYDLHIAAYTNRERKMLQTC